MKTKTIDHGRQKVVILEFETVAIPHCVSTRQGGISANGCATANVAFVETDVHECVVANRKLICATAKLNGLRFAFMEQVHGSEIGVIRSKKDDTIDRAIAQPGVDGLICNIPGITLMAKSADCPVVLIHDVKTPAMAVVHSGWRGTRSDVVGKAVKAMVSEFGSSVDDMVAGIAPSIAMERFEVAWDVIRSFKSTFADLPESLYEENTADEGGKLNLGGIVQWQLNQCGVKRVEQSDLCTYERVDLFYSHRRDGDETGRFGLFAQLPVQGN